MSDGSAPPTDGPSGSDPAAESTAASPGSAHSAPAVAPVSPRAGQRAADRWFREQGLPTFVPLRRWFTDVPRRVAPLVAGVTIAAALLEDGLEEAVDAALSLVPGDEWIVSVLVLAILALIGVIAWAGYRAVRWAVRRLSPAAGTTIAAAVLVGSLVVLIVGGYQTRPRAVVSPVFEGIAIVLGCVLIVAAGGGALLAWGSRLAVRNASAVGHMASIALPVILMLVVFAFFSAEVWQIGSALSWGSIALIGAVVAALALIVVMRVCASEIDELHQTLTPAARMALLAGTPAERSTLSTPPTPLPLRLIQRGNVMLVMAVAQLMQAVLFAALLWGLLLLIGAIAIPIGLVELWVGPGSAAHPLTVERMRLGGAELPITVNLVKTSAMMSIIASLPFVLSAVSEQRYRERFFDPIMVELRQAILVRDVLFGGDRAARRTDEQDVGADVSTASRADSSDDDPTHSPRP